MRDWTILGKQGPHHKRMAARATCSSSPAQQALRGRPTGCIVLKIDREGTAHLLLDRKSFEGSSRK